MHMRHRHDPYDWSHTSSGDVSEQLEREEACHDHIYNCHSCRESFRAEP